MTGGVTNVELVPLPVLTLTGGPTLSLSSYVIRDDAPQTPYISSPTQIGNTQSFPITYKAGGSTQITASVTFQVSPTKTTPTVLIKGSGGGYNFPEVKCTITNGEARYYPATATSTVAPAISTSTLDINWQYFRTSDKTWVSAGTSHNDTYVTLSGNSGLETVLDIANRGNLGKNGANQGALFTGVWDQFVGTSGTKRADDKTMRYYGAGNTVKGSDVAIPIDPADPLSPTVTFNSEWYSATGLYFSKEELIANLDGRCGAWQALMLSSLAVQNVSAVPITVWPSIFQSDDMEGTPPVLVRNTYKGFAIKIDKSIPGQGSANPQYIFNNHAIVKYDGIHNGALYDPSYGKPYVGIDPRQEWETKSLEGIWVSKDKQVFFLTKSNVNFKNIYLCYYQGY